MSSIIMKLVNSSILVCLISMTVYTVGCPVGWEGNGSSCYLFVQRAEIWSSASAHCRAFNAELAVVDTANEDQFIQGILHKLHGAKNSSIFYFIDGTDLPKEGSWVWATSSMPVNYFNWCHGDPDDQNGQDCLAYGGYCGFLWDDVSCLYHHFFICEKEGDGGQIFG